MDGFICTYLYLLDLNLLSQNIVLRNIYDQESPSSYNQLLIFWLSDTVQTALKLLMLFKQIIHQWFIGGQLNSNIFERG